MFDQQTASGINWAYELLGEGEALLFIHGWGVDNRIWRQQTKYFSKKNYKVISIDLPGHGRTSYRKVPLTTMVDDINEILRDLAVYPLTVIGSSLGGLIGLKFYERYPQAVKRLIFVGSMPKFSQSEDYPYGLDVGEIRKLSRQLDMKYPSVINIFFRSLFTRDERESRRFRWIQKFRQYNETPMQEALLEYLDILEKEDLRETLEKIHIPFQFIRGREDNICDRQTELYLRQLVPQGRFDIFDNCGHFPFLTKPYEFNETMEDFLNETKETVNT